MRESGFSGPAGNETGIKRVQFYGTRYLTSAYVRVCVCVCVRVKNETGTQRYLSGFLPQVSVIPQRSQLKWADSVLCVCVCIYVLLCMCLRDHVSLCAGVRMYLCVNVIYACA